VDAEETGGAVVVAVRLDVAVDDVVGGGVIEEVVCAPASREIQLQRRAKSKKKDIMKGMSDCREDETCDRSRRGSSRSLEPYLERRENRIPTTCAGGQATSLNRARQQGNCPRHSGSKLLRRALADGAWPFGRCGKVFRGACWGTRGILKTGVVRNAGMLPSISTTSRAATCTTPQQHAFLWDL
jgi:hypothetical protein